MIPIREDRVLRIASLTLALLSWVCVGGPAGAADQPGLGGGVDTALAVAVDVSQSVSADRYRLQMEGIARALENSDVIDAITAGQRSAILFSMIVWSDKAEIAVPWQRIATRQDARNIAQTIRTMPPKGGEFTCLARMLRTVADVLIPALPEPATRTVLDVSGDGIDNCSERGTTDSERDRLVARGATINGLPIIVKGENDTVGSGAYRSPGFAFGQSEVGPDSDTTTLDEYYRSHVIGGYGAFFMTAQGYPDFGRAIARKFVAEISALPPASVSPGSAERLANR